MKFKDMSKFFNIGDTIKVGSIENLTDDVYAMPKMMGKFLGISEDNIPDVMILTIDWSAFDDINIPLESHDWYIDTNGNLGTMKEADIYPIDGIETLFVMKEDIVNFSKEK